MAKNDDARNFGLPISSSEEQMKTLKFLTLIAVFTLSAPFTRADTVFTDGTFNLADYSISTFQTGGATINITQTLTGGDPGSALQILTTLPSPVAESFSSVSYIVNNDFLYDPSSQGAVNGIGVSVDVYRLFTGQNPSQVGFSPLIFQGGNYYVFHSIITPYTPGVYEPTSGTLSSSQFDLVTNLSSGALNTSIHPDFDGGPLELGFTSGVSSSGISQTVTADARYDNLSFDLMTATPEPAAYALILVGLGAIGLGSLRHRPR
jgi:PEP-CTERM motif-containing protein